MNLHGIVRGLITAVNPDVDATLQVSKGYSNANGIQVPAYGAPQPVRAQVQDLSQRDIDHLDSMNIQGSQKVVYLRGEISGLVRGNKGGDLLKFEDGVTWLVTAVLEQWPDWAKVSVTLQDN